MNWFNDIETCALRQIAEHYPNAKSEILDLFQMCIVTKRNNTGGGFFTDLGFEIDCLPPLSLRSPLGDAWIKVDGLRYGICCIAFLKNGYPTLLEGYSVGGEDTSKIDFDAVNFTMCPGPPMIEDDGREAPQ